MFTFLIAAAGLYYLAEIVEEYTVYTAKLIKYLTLVSQQSILFHSIFKKYVQISDHSWNIYRTIPI